MNLNEISEQIHNLTAITSQLVTKVDALTSSAANKQRTRKAENTAPENQASPSADTIAPTEPPAV